MIYNNKIIYEQNAERTTSGFARAGVYAADTFVLIFKRVARPSICETPALAKPPPRYLQAADSALGQ